MGSTRRGSVSRRGSGRDAGQHNRIVLKQLDTLDDLDQYEGQLEVEDKLHGCHGGMQKGAGRAKGILPCAILRVEQVDADGNDHKQEEKNDVEQLFVSVDHRPPAAE